MRLKGKTAIIVGGGQTAGDTIGNGRATALLFAREGARVLVADRILSSAEDTCAMIAADGGTSSAIEADVTREDDCRRLVAACVERYGRIDILHNNIGIGAGDASVQHMDVDAFERIFRVNLEGPLLTSKHALPVMREQGAGVIINISSIASIAAATNIIAYKTSKAALNALTQAMAMANARYGIRVNAILPGLINTPMAVEGISAARGIPKEQLIAERDRQVPMGKMGSAWDVAHAALFLASDEASFITGVLLPVDGGQSVRVG
ncbi:MAG: glucose 1-dehydrogenase [Dehalococcoidia bacterium]|nr:MAG: glucose 1-dehydrogenase [Dehalococcoidia bacterium]